MKNMTLLTDMKTGKSKHFDSFEQAIKETDNIGKKNINKEQHFSVLYQASCGELVRFEIKFIGMIDPRMKRKAVKILDWARVNAGFKGAA